MHFEIMHFKNYAFGYNYAFYHYALWKYAFCYACDLAYNNNGVSIEESRKCNIDFPQDFECNP